jgi:hypothetical protein
VGNVPNTTQAQVFPIVIPVRSGVGVPAIAQVTTRIDPQGQIDVGELTPGVYQMRIQGPNQEGQGRVALVEVNANSTRTLDLSAPSRDMAPEA